MTSVDIDEITGKVIGAAMKVHRVLGRGFQEVIYQRALEIEFSTQLIEFRREMSIDIFYLNHYIGRRRVDFYIEDFLIVELKAVSQLDDIHLNQTMNYCQAYKLPIGLLIHFGAKSLEFKRVYNLSHPQNQAYLNKH